MDPRDIALQSMVPTVMVPKFSPLEPLKGSGHRFLVTGSGMWLEVQRDWMRICVPLVQQTQVAMPYGTVSYEMSYTIGERLPRHLVEEFVAEARKRLPYECAGWIVWNRAENSMRLQMLEDIEAGKAHTHFHRPQLADDEQMIIDIHSHGRMKAFFSPEDDRDDAGEVKISVVVGNLDRLMVSAEARLCAMGMYLDFPAPPLNQAVEEMAYV